MTPCPGCNKEAPVGSRFCPFCGGKLNEPAKKNTDPLIGKVVDGKYVVQERIGTGAMGSIYKAEHKALSKVVALKVLHRHLVREESHVKRFHREARAASRLNHPNCITILDFGQTDDGWSFIAMEYLPGRDLCRILFEEGPLAPDRVTHIIAQVLDALDEAHNAGVVHRDLKPENIMVEKLRSNPDFVKVLDFGIAKIQDYTGGEQSSFKTATGMVFGTPEYMSPEQIRGEELDGRSDLYSLGVVMYHVLAGTLPFQGESVLEVATAHLTQPPPPLQKMRADLPAGICKVVATLMAKKRDDRYQNAAEARKALLAALDQDAQRADPVAVAIAAPAGQAPASGVGPAAWTPPASARVGAGSAAGAGLMVSGPAADPIGASAALDGVPGFPTTPQTRRLSSFRNLMLVLIGLLSAAALIGAWVVLSGGN